MEQLSSTEISEPRIERKESRCHYMQHVALMYDVWSVPPPRPLGLERVATRGDAHIGNYRGNYDGARYYVLYVCECRERSSTHDVVYKPRSIIDAVCGEVAGRTKRCTEDGTRMFFSDSLTLCLSTPAPIRIGPRGAEGSDRIRWRPP